MIDINDLNIDRILVSIKYPIIKKCFRFFIGYVKHSDYYDMTPLDAILPKLKRSSFSQVNYISLVLEKKKKNILKKKRNMG